MTGKTVLHADEDDSRLTADRWVHGSGVTLSVGDSGELVDVSTDDFPALVAKLYETAGLPAPVILSRPETTPSGTRTPLGTIYPYKSLNGPHVAVGFKNGDRYLSPAEAREAAAALAAYADAIEPEPDPAEVDALATVLVDGTGAMGIEGARPLARKVLLAGYRREADGAYPRGTNRPKNQEGS